MFFLKVVFFFCFWWAYSVQSFKWLMKRRGKSIIIILAIEILLWGHHSSVCTAKAYEEGSCQKIFKVVNIFVLNLTFQQPFLTLRKLISISPKLLEKQSVLIISQEVEVHSNLLNVKNEIWWKWSLLHISWSTLGTRDMALIVGNEVVQISMMQSAVFWDLTLLQCSS